MSGSERGPAWWQLYAVVPGMMGLVWLIGRSGMAGGIELAATIVVILAGFGAMLLWVKLNESALSRGEFERVPGVESFRVRIYQPTEDAAETEADAASDDLRALATSLETRGSASPESAPTPSGQMGHRRFGYRSSSREG